MTMTNMEKGIRHLMTTQGLTTVAELADRAELSAGTVKSIMDGRGVRTESMERLAAALKVSVAELYEAATHAGIDG